MNKFIDINGVKTLWQQISLGDYPNNETLIAVISAIDETKADKVQLDDYLTKKDYIAGESGGSIDLSSFLTKIEAQELFASKNVLEMAYPVGAIYLSVNNVNPNVLFGFGSWEQIKDTFLLATGDIYSAGSTGGEAEHLLTTEEIPSHTHIFNRHQLWRTETVPASGESDGYGASNKTLKVYADNTSTIGGGQAHNNMPPYLAVYMWKRIE